MGWNYALNWLVTLPLELTAASITLSFWPGAKDVNPAAFVFIFWLAVVIINLFGVRGYGEAEFVFSIIKVIAVCPSDDLDFGTALIKFFTGHWILYSRHHNRHRRCPRKSAGVYWCALCKSPKLRWQALWTLFEALIVELAKPLLISS
jgi:hypothetical protein